MRVCRLTMWFSPLSLQKELVESDLELAREHLEKKVAIRSLQEQRNFFDFLHFSPLKVRRSAPMAVSPQAIA